MKFAHLILTKEDCKKLHLKVMDSRFIIKILNEIHIQQMEQYHESYCPNAVWDLMQNRCIIITEKNKVLLFKNIFDKIIEIYEKKGSDFMSFYEIKEFNPYNPIAIMLARNQVSEC